MSDTATHSYSLSEFSIEGALKKGWEVFKENWVQLLILGVVYFVALQVPSFVLGMIAGDTGILMFVVQIAMMIWSAYLSLGMMKYVFALTRGEKVELSSLFQNSDKFVPYVKTYIHYLVVILLGFIAFVIPGIYFSFKYAFVLFLAADGKANGSDAFKMSAKMTEGRKITMFLYGLVSFFLVLGGFILLIIPGFIASAVSGLGWVLIYQYLLKHAAKTE